MAVACASARVTSFRITIQTPYLGATLGATWSDNLSGIPDCHEQRTGTRPRSRTDLNGSGCPHMELRIRRLGVRVPPSAPANVSAGQGPHSRV